MTPGNLAVSLETTSTKSARSACSRKWHDVCRVGGWKGQSAVAKAMRTPKRPSTTNGKERAKNRYAGATPFIERHDADLTSIPASSLPHMVAWDINSGASRSLYSHSCWARLFVIEDAQGTQDPHPSITLRTYYFAHRSVLSSASEEILALLRQDEHGIAILALC